MSISNLQTATISTILNNSLNIVEEEQQQAPPKSMNAPPDRSASSILLEARRFQNSSLLQPQEVFHQSTKSTEISPFHCQILHSQICDNPRLNSLMQNNSSRSNNSSGGRKKAAAKAHVTITKAKRIRMEKGEAYKDKVNERIAQQAGKKARLDRLKSKI